MQSLQHIRIVLVETSYPGNIGAAARAMKTMCLKRLYLVRPKNFPHAKATARACGAADVLVQSVVCKSLDEALSDARLVVGTSARARTLTWPGLDPRQCARKLISESLVGEVALVFGHERTGLTNAQLDRCHYVSSIPCNPTYGSLNLAAAVQVMAYEVMMSMYEPAAEAASESVAPMGEVELFYRHLEETLVALRFLDPQNPRHLMRRLRRLFNRTRLTTNEVNILRGILTAARGLPGS